MKKILLLPLLVSVSFPALAQPIEREALSPLNMPTYQQDVPKGPVGGEDAPAPAKMQPIPNPQSVNEQMARDAAENPPPPDTALPATPPPGPDSISPQSDTAPLDVTGTTGSNVSPAGDTRPPAPVSVPPQPGEGFPNGKTPPDQNMGNRVFCNIRVAFTKSADASVYDLVKSYVETNADTVKRVPVKPSKSGGDTFCLMVDQHNKRAKTYKDIRKLLPMKTRKDTGITLSGEGFSPVSTRD